MTLKEWSLKVVFHGWGATLRMADSEDKIEYYHPHLKEQCSPLSLFFRVIMRMVISRTEHSAA